MEKGIDVFDEKKATIFENVSRLEQSKQNILQQSEQKNTKAHQSIYWQTAA